MSTYTTPVNTDNQMTTNYDFSKVFLGNNTFEKATLIKLGAGTVDIPVGTLLGRISASGKVTILKSAAVDGSEIPVGILARPLTGVIQNAENVISMCVSGSVAKDKVVLDGANTLDTVIDGRMIKDRIAGDTLGIKLYAGVEMTNTDNI